MLFFRTLLIYLILIVSMRLMGKRQIAELEITDLVTTLLISEIASLPITDTDIPISHAIIPILALLGFEVLSSFLLAQYPKVKGMLSARPAVLIQDGVISEKAMRQARISADELISELRQQGIADPEEVRYAILEQNGKISVIRRQKFQPPTAEQWNMSVEDSGLYHIIIDKGIINHHSLQELELQVSDIRTILQKQGQKEKDIYLMMMNDSGDFRILPTKKEK